MIHIAALNDYSGDESESEPVIETTKEAQEAEAYALYNKALELQRGSLHREAELHYKKLLNTSLLTKAVASEDGKTDQILVQPGFMLKYSTYKNLASLASQKNDKKTAMEFYLEAVNIDSTDVSLWYKIGHLALELVHVPLARIAFEEAYQCNPKHWPSLDNLCTVLYALYDYPSCLYYIAKCFELDSCYPKGHVLRKKIFSEQPALERETFALFEQCDESVFDRKFISEDQSEKILEEAFDLRNERDQLSKKSAPTLVKFRRPLKSLTWKCLGECLVSLYDYLDGAERPLSFSCRLDLAGYLSMKDDDIVMDITPVSQQSHGKEEVPKEVVEEKGMPSSIDEHPTAFTMDIYSVPATSSAPKSMSLSTQDTQRESLTVAMETDHDYAGSSIEKSKRGPKRKRGLGDEPAPGKRRSARVRNTTTKKKEEIINYQTLLRGFLPSSLRNIDDIDESSQDSCIASEENRTSTVKPLAVSSADTQQERIPWKASEESDITGFLEMCVDNNNGVIDVMSRYLVNLSRRCSLKWPSGLASVFISCYDKLRKHLQLPSIFCNDSSTECLSNIGNMVLVYVELKLDRWIENISNLPTTITPKKSLKLFSLDLGPDFPSQFYHQDVAFTEQIATLPDVLSHKYVQYVIRVYWVKARFLVLDGKMESALESFDLCSQLLTPQNKDENSSGELVVVKLPNCNNDDTISLEQVSKKKESLQRTQSLEEVRRLFDAGQYSQVSTILLPTLKQPLMATKSIGEQKSSERPSQILLLLQSLLKQEEYQECLSCAEIALIETIYEINHAHDITSKEEWIEGLVQVCIAIDRAIASAKLIIKKLESVQLVRLTNNLIRIIEIAMETPEVGEVGQVSTVYPWILLYKLIKHEEDQIESMKIAVTIDSTSPSNRPCLPSSLMLLLTAHEYLGRRSWCCNDKGALLKLHVSVLEEELFNRLQKDAHPFKSDLEHALEQSFYCLYSHPNRKAKARHLVDHGVDEVPLLWEDTKFLFEYFKPKNLPEFDSYKTSTMSSELESLLLKIYRIIPAQKNPANTIESMQAFLEGTTDTVPCIPPDKPVKLHVVQELYYLLADYNFKNKEWGKAIKFYLHDLCVNPERFDSWAGMAMARSTRLELKINSCDSKSEGPIYKRASSAARCFERALQIDASNSTLWMEYGSLSYMMYAYSSRQLKQQHAQSTISTETEEFLKTKKNELLKQAKKCYQTASECEGDGEEEEWLVHYMLGKIAEKEHALPQVYLDHYKKAAMSLHENEARYPKKIPYHNPPDLALESLEIFFRIHTSILKLLESPNKSTVIDYKLLKRYISEARQFPFARGLEKKAEGRDYSTSDTDTEGKLVNPKVHHHRSSAGRRSTIQQLMDHDYFETGNRISRTTSQESTDTASDLDFFSSGDEPMSPRPTDSNSFQGGIRSAKPPDVSLLLSGFSKKRSMKGSLDKDKLSEKTSGSSSQEDSGSVKCDIQGSAEEPKEQSVKKEPSLENFVVESTMAEKNINDSSIVEFKKSNESTTPTFMPEGIPSPSTEKSADDLRNIILESNLNDETADSVPSFDAAMDISQESIDMANDSSNVASEAAASPKKVVMDAIEMSKVSAFSGNPVEAKDMFSNDSTAVSEEFFSQTAMGTTEAADSNKDVASEAERNMPTAAMDTANFVQDISMDMAEGVTDSVAHSACANQIVHESDSNTSVSKHIDSYKIDDAAKDVTESDDQGNECRDPDDLSGGSVNQYEMLDVDKDEELPNSPTITTLPQRFKQKHGLCKTPEVPKHISSFQMAFLMSPLLFSEESAEESGLSQTESEDASESLVSEDLVKNPIGMKKEDNIKTSDHCSKSQQSDSIAKEEDVEGMPKTQTFREMPQTFPKATMNQTEITDVAGLEKGSAASSQPVAVGVSEILKNLRMEYQSSGESQSEEEMNRSGTGKVELMEESLFNLEGQDVDDKDRKSMRTSGIKVDNADNKEDIKGKENLEEENVDLSTKDRETGDDEKDDFVEIFGEGNLERKVSIAIPERKEIPVSQSITLKDTGITGSLEQRDKNKIRSEGTVKKSMNVIELANNVQPKIETNEKEKKRIDLNEKEEDAIIIETNEREIKEEKMGTNVRKGDHTKMDTDEIEETETNITANEKEGMEKAEEKKMDTIQKTDDTKKKNEEIYKEDSNKHNPDVEKSDMKSTSSDNGDDKKSLKAREPDQRNSEEHVQLINECLLGLKLCLSRFSQHYKALYRMAHVYHCVPTHKNDRWSRDILLGTSTPWNQIPHLAAPALFADANKTKNFFQGIWRIPVEEIDRSGSFPSHMYRAIQLLIDVLLQLSDHQMLLQLSVKLNRTPELNKKYLRDQDRQFLSKQSYEKCLVVLKDLIGMYKPGPKEQQRLITMFVYRANQVRQNKLQITATSTNSLLIEAFRNFRGNKVDNEPGILEQAVRYCTSIEGSKLPHTPETLSIQLKAAKDSSKHEDTPTTRDSTLTTSKNSDATLTTSKKSEATPTTNRKSEATPTTNKKSEATPTTNRKSEATPTTNIPSGATLKCTDDTSQSRGLSSTTFADQFKHFASSFSASKLQQSTKRVLNMGHETKETKKPLLQVLSDEDLGTAILDKRSKVTTKDTSISLKGLAERTQAIVKASITLSRQESLDFSASSAPVADPVQSLSATATTISNKLPSFSSGVTKQTSISTKIESALNAASVKTSIGSSMISSPPKATVGSSLSASPPKGSFGSGLTIPFHRIALGGSQHIKLASSRSGSSQSDASKSSQGSSGIHARVLPFMSVEEKEKLKSSLLQFESTKK